MISEIYKKKNIRKFIVYFFGDHNVFCLIQRRPLAPRQGEKSNRLGIWHPIAAAAAIWSYLWSTPLPSVDGNQIDPWGSTHSSDDGHPSVVTLFHTTMVGNYAWSAL